MAEAGEVVEDLVVEDLAVQDSVEDAVKDPVDETARCFFFGEPRTERYRLWLWFGDPKVMQFETLTKL